MPWIRLALFVVSRPLPRAKDGTDVDRRADGFGCSPDADRAIWVVKGRCRRRSPAKSSGPAWVLGPPRGPWPAPRSPAYKQLLAVERGWRDFKGALGLRPVFHYREDRIRAHIQLCWLALLLLRVIENATGDTWRNVRHELDRMHLITLSTDHGRVAQRSATTPGQRTLFPALDLPEPPRFYDFAAVPDST